MDSLHQLVPPGGWRTTGYARIPPLQKQTAGWSKRMLIFAIGQFGNLDATNLWLMMMHNMRLLQGYVAFARRLMPFGELPRQDTELVILRVAWNCRSRYEWGQHVDIGMRVGLQPEQIARIAQGPDAPGWEHRQVALLRAADEFHHERMISESTWQMLAGFLDQRLLLELLMLIGFYEGLAGALNSAGLPLDAAPERLLTGLKP